jgi:phosphate transport system substrate-binding protein
LNRVLLFALLSAAAVSADIAGAGSTFAAPLYQRWIETFQGGRPGAVIHYSAVGSTEGLRQLKAGTVDFAASDIPLTDKDRADLGLAVVEVPTAVGAVVPVYNLPGMPRDLRFTPEVLAGIYLGKVRQWNDPEIRAANRGKDLPAEGIRVVHRSDGSGTTYIWTSLLARASAEWKSRVGAAAQTDWPVGTGANGNGAVAELVARTPYSLGYTEFIYAVEERLSYGAVRNQAGKFVQPDSESIRKGAAHPDDAGAYPVVAATYLVMPAVMRDPAKKALLSEFVTWALDEGQNQAAALGFIALPEEMRVRARGMLAELK